MTEINQIVRGFFAWPLALVGLCFSYLAEGCIRSAAWIMDADPDEEDDDWDDLDYDDEWED